MLVVGRKISTLIRLLFIFLLLWIIETPTLPAQAAPTAIDFGTTLTGAISTAGEEDTFTFTAQAGDIVLVRMSVTSGSLSPYIQVEDNLGNSLCDDYAYSQLAEISACTLSEAGTYTLRATDYGDTDTGNYQLYLQRLNEPGNAIQMTFGETLSGYIAKIAGMDTYTFTAQSADVVVVQMTLTSGELYPQISIYDPAGNKLCTDHGFSRIAFIASCVLPISGQYTILTGDYRGAKTGIYNLHLQRLNNPVNGKTLVFDQVQSGTIAAAAELEPYTFEGQIGDVVLARMAATSAGGLDPHLRIYDPHQELVCEGYDAHESLERLAEVARCGLATAGTYTVLTGDHGG
ncbi:MAG: PPC domain-containing protein [Anaerolineae bacterium]|nr:PPC domain-containing protein [Anaerolineae bacterium]